MARILRQQAPPGRCVDDRYEGRAGELGLLVFTATVHASLSWALSWGDGIRALCQGVVGGWGGESRHDTVLAPGHTSAGPVSKHTHRAEKTQQVLFFASKSYKQLK